MKERIKEYMSGYFELREADAATGEFTGYASRFNEVVPSFNEVVAEGAFTKTLKENSGQVPILFNHDPNQWIGQGLSAVEDKRGLLVSGKLAVDGIQLASEVHSVMQLAMESEIPASYLAPIAMLRAAGTGAVRLRGNRAAIPTWPKPLMMVYRPR